MYLEECAPIASHIALHLLNHSIVSCFVVLNKFTKMKVELIPISIKCPKLQNVQRK